MDIRDPVYGEFSIRDGVIQELVRSAPMQRLRFINQAGALQYVDPSRYVNTRFGHSLGVYYLLRKFNAPLEEQIAGLLHDIGHTAFSHVSDYLLEGSYASYHDSQRRRVIIQSEIPAILSSHGIGLKDVMETEGFLMMKKPVPDICADVLDYFFRDAVVYGLSEGIRDDVRLFISALQVQPCKAADAAGNEFVFSNIEIAKRASLAFIECNQKFWSDGESIASSHMLAEAMKAAMASGDIEMKDLMLTDSELYSKMKGSKKQHVIRSLNRLRGLRAAVSGTGNIFACPKTRYLDPKVMQNGKTKRLSEYDSGYKAAMNDFIASMERGFYVKVE